MRIGVDARLLNKNGTGISRYIYEFLRRVIALDTKNTYVVFLHPEMKGKFSEFSHVEEVLTDAKHYSLKEQTVFFFQLLKNKLDFVHFPHFNAPVLYFKRHILTVHDITISKFPGKKMSDFLHKLAYQFVIWWNIKKAHHIISVSKHTKKDLCEVFKVHEKKITPIYLGIDDFKNDVQEEEKQAYLKSLGIQKEFLLYVGVWRDHKNMVRLIEAFEKVKQKGEDIFLVMTGKPSPYYPEIQEKIKNSPYKKDIILPGFVSDKQLKILYRAAKLLINPSLYEGFGIPPLEAMASSTPAVISNVTSHPEVCQDAAWYFDPKDSDDMADKIVQILRDEDLYKEYRETGQKHVLGFTWDKTARETLRVYDTNLKYK